MSVIACGLLVNHTRTFTLKRDTAVMIGTTLPELKASVALLSANMQAEQRFAENALGAREEQATVYVLPTGQAAARAVQSLNAIASALTSAGGTVAVSRLTFAPASVDRGSIRTLGADLQLTGNFRSVARFLGILGYSGTMMVRDALSDEATDTFLRQMETLSPLSLNAAENFLYTDLLAYAAAPDQAEQLMLSDLAAEAQADIRSFLLQAGLARIRSAFSGIAPDLRDLRVWPLPLVSVQSMTRNGDQWNVALMFYRR